MDLAGGWLNVRGTTTDEADCKVKIRGALRAELLALRQRHQDAPQSAYVFPTGTGGKVSQDNFRSRVLGQAATIKDGKRKPCGGAIARANHRLEAAELPSLPEKITPQSMRRTFASILYALGATPVEVMQELGHSDPALALKVYAQAMRRSEEEKAKLRALDRMEWPGRSGRSVKVVGGLRICVGCRA